MGTPTAISHLRDRLAAVQTPATPPSVVDFFGEQARSGVVHEWFGGSPPGEDWLPPLCVLTDLARRFGSASERTATFWIGRACWPYPLLLDRHPTFLRSCVFIDPPDRASRLWAIDVALRCQTPSIVIADGSGFTLAHTRRLQLAAGARGGVCLLARPGKELDGLSAATTRWMVEPDANPTVRPRWIVTLLRNKDRPVITDRRPEWSLEWNDGEACLHLPAPLADRSDRAAVSAAAAERRSATA